MTVSDDAATPCKAKTLTHLWSEVSASLLLVVSTDRRYLDAIAWRSWTMTREPLLEAATAAR